jgi:hypothetical protein
MAGFFCTNRQQPPLKFSSIGIFKIIVEAPIAASRPPNFGPGAVVALRAKAHRAA